MGCAQGAAVLVTTCMGFMQVVVKCRRVSFAEGVEGQVITIRPVASWASAWITSYVQMRSMSGGSRKPQDELELVRVSKKFAVRKDVS